MKTTITVIGAGVMGTALAVHLACRTFSDNRVRLCGTAWDDDIVDILERERYCPRLEVDIPDKLELMYDVDWKKAVDNTDILVLAVISKGLRDTVAKLAYHAVKGAVMVSITKGIDGVSRQTVAEMMEQVLQQRGRQDISIVKLGGPLRANELAQGFPAAAIFASRSSGASDHVRKCFAAPHFQSETSTDVIGVDICASLKNAYAIAFGIIDGLYRDRDNPKAALFGQATHELRTFVAAYGGKAETVSHLAGVGDLFVTVQGGRNRSLGYYLGQGFPLQEAVAKMKGQTVEGMDAITEGLKIAQFLERRGKLVIQRDLPLFSQLCSVVKGEMTAVQAFEAYWNRPLS